MAKCLLRVSKLVGMCNIVSLQKRERERGGEVIKVEVVHFILCFFLCCEKGIGNTEKCM